MYVSFVRDNQIGMHLTCKGCMFRVPKLYLITKSHIIRIVHLCHTQDFRVFQCAVYQIYWNLQLNSFTGDNNVLGACPDMLQSYILFYDNFLLVLIVAQRYPAVEKHSAEPQTR